MPTIALLGASGTLGRRVADHLSRRDAGDVVAVVRRQPPAPGYVVRVAATREVGGDVDAAGWRRAVDDVDVVVCALPPPVATVAVAAAVAAGRTVVDACDGPRHLRSAYGELAAAARESGAALVPGIGWRTAVGDLLTAVAAERVVAPREVHVAAVVPEAGGVLGAATPGVRAGLAEALGEPWPALVHGDLVDELPGESRRLAWFPRPFGPHHAAGVPGAEPLSVPRHVAGVRTVRSYVALSSARAELLQALASASRHEPVRRRVAASLRRRGSTAGARWAVVTEVAGPDDQLVRAWANGRDHLDASARLLVAVTASVLAAPPGPGVHAPAQAGDPRTLLDEVTAGSEVRWSVNDPRR